jgi:hypothetical protein
MHERFVRDIILALSPALALAQPVSPGVPDGFTFAAGGDLISPKPFDLDNNKALASLRPTTMPPTGVARV